MKTQYIISMVLASSLALVACGNSGSAQLRGQPDGLYGEIVVNDQSIFFTLYYQEVPLTVSNFVGLATGKFSENIDRKGNYFDGIVFHRVANNFVIQGGDPTGTGSGGPGYNFSDEFNDELKHDSEGILSMANSGPGTNGSQFFITLAPAPHLDNKHSVFGKVIIGGEIPATVVQGDIMQNVNIFAKGTEAKAFLDELTWDNFQAMQEAAATEASQALSDAKKAVLEEIKQNSELTESQEGLFYKLENEGNGQLVKNGDTVQVHYELTLYGSTNMIDSSYRRNQPLSLQVGAGRVISGWEIMLQKLRVGDKARVIIPPELAYGDEGAGNVIPGGSFLSFVMEVISIDN